MKKSLIVIAVIFVVYYLFLRSKPQTPPQQAEPVKEPAYEDEYFIFENVEPYQVKKNDSISLIGYNLLGLKDSEFTKKGKADILRDFVSSVAGLNGMDKDKIDGVPTADETDPDYLKIGQIISLPTDFATKYSKYEVIA